MRGAFARALYDPERLRRHLLRLHQPHAGDRDARLRGHRDGFRDRMPDGQACPSHRHGPDGVPYPQCLSRRRHEGAPARSQEHRADRMRAGRRRKVEMAVARGIQADVLAQGRRRRTRFDSARGGEFVRAGARRPRSSARPTIALRSRPPGPRRCNRAAPPAAPPPPAPQPASHGAVRFSSVFGSRRR